MFIRRRPAVISRAPRQNSLTLPICGATMPAPEGGEVACLSPRKWPIPSERRPVRMLRGPMGSGLLLGPVSAGSEIRSEQDNAWFSGLLFVFVGGGKKWGFRSDKEWVRDELNHGVLEGQLGMRTPILTFLHISDLHFGELDRSGNADLDPNVPLWCQAFPLFDGYLGHTRKALARLYNLFSDIQEHDPGVQVVVSGDLTTVGGHQEMQNALSFLEAEMPSGSLDPIGLRIGQVPPSVPGNHDHWPGVRATSPRQFVMFGVPINQFTTAFRTGTLRT